MGDILNTDFGYPPNKKKKKKKGKSVDMMDVGFNTDIGLEASFNQGKQKSDNMFEPDAFSFGEESGGGGVWNFGDPFGFSGKKSKKKSSRRIEEPSMSDGFDLSMMGNMGGKQPQISPEMKRSGTVVKNVIVGLNKRIAERSERKRFDKSQPNAEKIESKRYVITITSDDGESRQELYDSPNQAWSAKQQWQGREGYTVSPVRIMRE